jgi:hypothetical protein
VPRTVLQTRILESVRPFSRSVVHENRANTMKTIMQNSRRVVDPTLRFVASPRVVPSSPKAWRPLPFVRCIGAINGRARVCAAKLAQTVESTPLSKEHLENWCGFDFLVVRPLVPHVFHRSTPQMMITGT